MFPFFYTLSLHDALPILAAFALAAYLGFRKRASRLDAFAQCLSAKQAKMYGANASRDRKSTRLNSSHSSISYAVFCLKKKKREKEPRLNRCSKYLERHTY